MVKLYWTGDVGYYDEKTGEGITSSMVKQQLDSAGGQDVEVSLMSRGGDFFQIAPIMGFIRAYPGKTVVRYAGLVASAASAFAMAFDEAISDDLSIFMLHNAQGWAAGDHRDMRDSANTFEQLTAMMADEYAKKSKRPMSEIKALMDGDGKSDGTWIMGAKIKELGFSDQHIANEGQTQNSSMMLLSAREQFRAGVSMWAGNRREVQMADMMMMGSMQNAERLIKAGKVDKSSPWSFTKADQDALLGDNGDDWMTYKLWHLVQDDELAQKTKERYKYPYGKGGLVYRSALRSIASRAAQNGLEELSTWASDQIKAIDAKGEAKVDKEQVVAWLKQNPGVNPVELFAEAGIKLTLATEDHVKGAELRAALVADKITDPVAEIKRLNAELKKVDTDRVTNALDAAFGKEKTTDGKDNLLRKHAATFFAGAKSDELEAKMEAFKKDPIALKLAGEQQDVNAEVNILGTTDKKPVRLAASQHVTL